jgi:hypothetical protein
LLIATGSNKVVNVTVSGKATAALPGSAQVAVKSTQIGYGYSGNNNALMSWNLAAFSIVDPITSEAEYDVYVNWVGSS